MLLSLAMIVRDEEAVLEECLRSVEGICDEVVIADTGSTDHTREIALAFGARVIDVPWHDDFSEARNASLAAARGDWVLVLDADERLDGTRAAFERVHAARRVVALNVAIVNELDGGQEDIHSAIRAFRRLPGVKYERRLHEQVLQSIVNAAPKGQIAVAPFRIRHVGYLRERVRSKGKGERNVNLARLEAEAAPDDPIAIYNLGIEYTALHEFDKATDAFELVRKMLPETYPWKSRLYKAEAQTLIRIGRHGDASEVLREGIACFPKFTDLYFLLGVAQEELGDLPAAERAFRKCLNLGPAACPPHDGVDPELGRYAPAFALGRVLSRRGRLTEARVSLMRAVHMRPGWMPAVRALVECTLAAGDDIEILGQNPPPDPLEVGAVLFRLGHYSLAIRQFGRAEELHPNLPVDHFYLRALAHLRMGDVEAAARSVAHTGEGVREDPRAYVVDLVAYAQGRISLEDLYRRYADQHVIWQDVLRSR